MDGRQHRFCLLLLALATATLAKRADSDPVCLPSQFESFDDGTISTDRYTLYASGACQQSPLEVGGKLVMAASYGCAGGGSQDLLLNKTNYRICGDYDIRVDFELTSFDVPATGYRVAGLEVDRWTDGVVVSVMSLLATQPSSCRIGGLAYEGYTQNGCSVPEAPTIDASGSLRITRVGSLGQMYYRSASGEWVEIHEGTVTTDDVTLAVLAGSNGVPDVGQEVHFDNLIISQPVLDVGPEVASTFRVAPNPAIGNIRFVLPPSRASWDLQAFDVSGRQVWHRTAPGSTTVLWGSEGLGDRSAAGVYLVRARSGGTTLYRRVGATLELIAVGGSGRDQVPWRTWLRPSSSSRSKSARRVLLRARSWSGSRMKRRPDSVA